MPSSINASLPTSAPRHRRPGGTWKAALPLIALIAACANAQATSQRQAADSTPSATEAPTLHLSHTRSELSPHLSRGYGHLQAGQLEAARRDYETALNSDPKNVDILLGLSAIARRQGRTADADYYCRQALEADPTSAMAQAAALGPAAAANPLAAESRLKHLLGMQPDSGPLNFSLGNLYSRQNRWREAQQMYFNAVAIDGDNPDYQFNLAVSLDRLRQPGLALQHYRLALDAADRHPAAFDRERVTRRLLDLAP